MNVPPTRPARVPSCLLLVVIVCRVAVSAAEMRVGQAAVPAGTTIGVPLTVSDIPGAVAAQFDVAYDPSLVALVNVTPGEAMAGHIVDHHETSPGRWRGLVYSATNGPMAAGALVWLTFSVPTSTPDGVVPLGLTNPIVARVEGQSLRPLAAVHGSLTVFSPGSFLSLAFESEGRLRIDLQGIEAEQYAVDVSTNLSEWAVLGTNTVAGGRLSIVETNLAQHPHRFYRARRLP